MVLLFNIYLTNTPGNSQTNLFDRGTLPSHSKLDVTKYSLASLAVAYPWTRAIINIELDPVYYSIEDQKNLEDYVNNTFTSTEVLFSSKRSTLQHEWRALYDRFNSDFIFYLGNHDHIFIDSDSNYLQELVETARSNYSKYATIITSHWPENIRWAKSGYIQLSETVPRQLNSDYRIEDNHLYYRGTCIDSLNIITKELYHEWFFSEEWGSIELPRLDGIGGLDLIRIKRMFGKTIPLQDIIIPYKEQLRHFDGYMHQRIDNRTCPALSIPEGFFEGQIKVRYGYGDYRPGWVNLDPSSFTYQAADLAGTDYKLTLQDIPLFWQDRIALFENNPYIEDMNMVSYRIHAILDMMYSDDRYNAYIDEEVQQNVMRQYLKVYKQYELI